MLFGPERATLREFHNEIHSSFDSTKYYGAFVGRAGW